MLNKGLRVCEKPSRKDREVRTSNREPVPFPVPPPSSTDRARAARAPRHSAEERCRLTAPAKSRLQSRHSVHRIPRWGSGLSGVTQLFT
ncbi:hypothetical protein FKM82_003197 [Ascaphus truei]